MDASNTNINSNNFSGRIRLLMSEKGLVQESLAKLLGVSQGTVSGWLNGAIPQRRTLDLIAFRLETTTEWLLHGGKRPELIYGPTVPLFREEPPVREIDWKARALAAEKELEELRATIQKVVSVSYRKKGPKK